MVIEAPSARRVALPALPLAAVLAVPLAAAITTWWVVGDRSFPLDRRQYLDYIWRQPAIPPVVEDLVGVVTTLGLLTCVGVLVLATRKRRMDQRWWAVTFLLGAAGFLCGLIERGLSAGFVGASIGGHLLAPLGLPLVAGLVLAAALLAGWIAASRPPA